MMIDREKWDQGLDFSIDLEVAVGYSYVETVKNIEESKEIHAFREIFGNIKLLRLRIRV